MFGFLCPTGSGKNHLIKIKFGEYISYDFEVMTLTRILSRDGLLKNRESEIGHSCLRHIVSI